MKTVIFLGLLTLVLVSCGMQSPYDIAMQMSPPYVKKIVPGDGKLTLYIEGQNSESGFAGYNVYMSDDYVDITQVVLLNSALTIPTVDISRADDVSVSSFTVSNGTTYSAARSGLETNIATAVSLDNGRIYYFWVSAYNGDLEYENSYASSYLVSSSPRPEVTDKIVSNGDIISLYGTSEHLKLTNSSGAFYFIPQTDTYISDSGYARSLTNVIYAPEDGYYFYPVYVSTNRLYTVKTASTNYGKVYVKEVNSSYIVVDYAYQITAELRSY